MPSTLASLLFKNYRCRVLGLLLLHADKAYHVREIARLTGTVPGTLHRELSKLAAAGVLQKSNQGNQVSYQANRNCLIFRELASIFRKTSGIADIVANALAPLIEQIDIALIFGSIASGKETAASDLDLLLVGEINYSEAVKALYPAQQIVGREINPKLYSRVEWLNAQEEQSVFIRELLEKPVIEIIGAKDDIR